MRRREGWRTQGLLLWMTALGGLSGVACENTEIFAQRQRALLDLGVAPERLCSEALPCPEDPCLVLRCEEGRCVAEEPSIELRRLDNTELPGALQSASLSTLEEEAEAPLTFLMTEDALFRWEESAGQPPETMSASPPPEVERIVYTGDQLFALSQRQTTLSELDPIRGSERATLDLSGPPMDVLVDGSQWWISLYDKGIQRVETSGGGVTLAGRYDTPGRADALAIGGAHLLVGDGFAGLSALAGSDELDEAPGAELPARLLTPALEQPTRGRVNALSISSESALTAEWGAGLGVFRLDPTLGPQRIATLPLSAPARQVIHVGAYRALLWTGEAELLWIDLWAPSAPRELQRLSLPWRPELLRFGAGGALVAARSVSREGEATVSQVVRLSLRCGE